MNIRELTANDPNRHTGVSHLVCNCGLVHDDELQTGEEVRNLVVDALGGKCSSSKCRWLNDDGTLGCSDKKLLHVDHVYNDGSIDRRGQSNEPYRWKGVGLWYWRRVLKATKDGSDRYQLLCANCNWLKRNYSFTAWKNFQKETHGT